MSVDETIEERWRRWIATRPECIQKLAKEFPPDSIILYGEVKFYLIGWTEDDKLIVSRTNPTVNYELALGTKEYLCAQHLRENIERVLDRS